MQHNVRGAEDLIGGIRSGRQQVELKDTIPLVEDLEIGSIFKDEAEEGGDSITDLVITIYQLLRQDLQELVDIMEPVKP